MPCSIPLLPSLGLVRWPHWSCTSRNGGLSGPSGLQRPPGLRSETRIGWCSIWIVDRAPDANALLANHAEDCDPPVNEYAARWFDRFDADREFARQMHESCITRDTVSWPGGPVWG
jgi:hypothetical protein